MIFCLSIGNGEGEAGSGKGETGRGQEEEDLTAGYDGMPGWTRYRVD